jgi:hypothetical protein
MNNKIVAAVFLGSSIMLTWVAFNTGYVIAHIGTTGLIEINIIPAIWAVYIAVREFRTARVIKKS